MHPFQSSQGPYLLQGYRKSLQLCRTALGWFLTVLLHQAFLQFCLTRRTVHIFIITEIMFCVGNISLAGAFSVQVI